MTKPKLNAVVAKNNYLIPKLAKMDLNELRLLTYCLAHFDSRVGTQEDYYTQTQNEFTATVKDLTEIFPGMGAKSAYSVIRKAVMQINKKPFEEIFTLPDGSREEILLYWFIGFRYRIAKGEFVFKMSPDIVNMALELKGDFTRFRLQCVYQFKSAITWKMYELLKQWEAAGIWGKNEKVTLDDLRYNLGLEGQYLKWTDFKKRLLDAPIAEINRLSDIRVSYQTTKKYRAINGLVFFVKSKEQETADNDSNLVSTVGDINRDVKLIMSTGINQTNAETLSNFAKDKGKDLAHILERIQARYESKPVEERGPKAAYIYRALESELSPTLFDNLDNKSRPSNIEELQRKISADNNKYAPQAWACPHYETKANDKECSVANRKTKKCRVCLGLNRI